MKKIYLPLLLGVLLTGCGGGGTTSAVSTTNGITDSNITSASAPSILTASQKSFLDAINAARAQDQTCGTTPMPKTTALVWNKKLELASIDHANDISANNYRQEDKNDPTVLMTNVDDGTIKEVTSINRHGIEHETFHVGSGTSTDVALGSYSQYNESTFVERIGHRGYTGYRTAGENITVGTNTVTAQQAVQLWIDSPKHCMNLMNPDFTEVGMGHVEVPNTFYTHYWVQEFGG